MALELAVHTESPPACFPGDQLPARGRLEAGELSGLLLLSTPPDSFPAPSLGPPGGHCACSSPSLPSSQQQAVGSGFGRRIVPADTEQAELEARGQAAHQPGTAICHPAGHGVEARSEQEASLERLCRVLHDALSAGAFPMRPLFAFIEKTTHPDCSCTRRPGPLQSTGPQPWQAKEGPAEQTVWRPRPDPHTKDVTFGSYPRWY
ncbi:hypothetical protein H8959_007178 [Pygathrix nigripes]